MWIIGASMASMCLPLLCMLALLQAHTSNGATAAKSTAIQKKTEEIGAKISKSNVIRLTDATFTKYITERPRSYHVLLMLTAESPNYGCTVCSIASATLTTASIMTNEQIDFTSIVNPSQRIVYFIADFDECPDLFTSLKINSVPRHFLLPPVTESDPRLKLSDFSLSDPEIHTNPSAMLALIAKKTGIIIVPAYPAAPILFVLVLFAVAVAFFIANISMFFNNTILWYKSPYIWTFISLLCFSVGVSGTISCIIRSAPLYGKDRLTPHIFATGGREQYLLEGIIVALWTIGSGCSLVLIHLSTKLPIPPLRHCLIILGMAMFIVFSLQIWNAYIDKTPWYSIKETLPEQVWTWLFSGIKKSSGVPKRLLRLSELFLTEFKDVKSFQKRVKLILGDYLQKMADSLLNRKQ